MEYNTPMSLATIPQASKWASDFLNKEVLPTNISYLVQYGKINWGKLVECNSGFKKIKI